MIQTGIGLPQAYLLWSGLRQNEAYGRQQIVSLKTMICFGFEIWHLGFIWDLEFGIWDFCDPVVKKNIIEIGPSL